MLGVHLSHGPQLQLVRTRAESDDIVPHKSSKRNVDVVMYTFMKGKKSEKFPYLLTFCVTDLLGCTRYTPKTRLKRRVK